MTEPQDPQSTPPSYPSYPGQQPPAPPGPPGGQNPYPTAPAESYPSQQYQQPGVQAEPVKRPGGVTAAGWITIILSFLTALSAAALFAASSRAAEEVLKYIEDNPGDLNLDASEIPTVDEIQGFVNSVGILFLVVAIIGLLLGVFVLKRQPWARILLLVTSVLTAICAIVPSLGIVGLPWLVGSIAAFVLLLTGKASAWFKAGRA